MSFVFFQIVVFSCVVLIFFLTWFFVFLCLFFHFDFIFCWIYELTCNWLFFEHNRMIFFPHFCLFVCFNWLSQDTLWHCFFLVFLRFAPQMVTPCASNAQHSNMFIYHLLWIVVPFYHVIQKYLDCSIWHKTNLMSNYYFFVIVIDFFCACVALKLRFKWLLHIKVFVIVENCWKSFCLLLCLFVCLSVCDVNGICFALFAIA